MSNPFTGSHGRPATVGHRGARSLAPENTLASFRKAIELGVDAVECDVHLTRDGHPVIFHDFTLERCTDYPERAAAAGSKLSPFLEDWTLAELRTLDAGSWFEKQDPFGQVKAGAVSADALASYRGERIPTLHELLTLCGDAGTPVVLEIKQGPRPSEELVKRCVAALRSSRLIERTSVICFDHPSLLVAKREEPQLQVGALLVERLANPARYARQTLGASLISVHCPPGAFLRHRPVDTSLGQDVRMAHEEGVALHVWTVNDPSDFKGLVEVGVDGIATDFPHLLLAAMR